MRRLILSLIVVVVAGIVSLGWIISQFYGLIATKQENAFLTEIEIYKQFGRDIAAVTQQVDTHTVSLPPWPQDSPFQFTLLDQEHLPLPPPLADQFHLHQEIVLESDSEINIYFTLPDQSKILEMTLPRKLINQRANTQSISLTILFYCSLVVLMLIWLVPLMRSLVGLKRSTEQFGKGDLSARHKVGRFSYIPDIEANFNRMAERIESLVSDNKLLGRAVSHDLKTPLARLRFGLESLEEVSDPAKRARYHDRIANDLDDMEVLVNQLLQFSRLDESHIALKRKPIAVGQFVSNLVSRGQEEGLHIRFEQEGSDFAFAMDEKYMKMLVTNLLVNAKQYAQVTVIVSLHRNHHGWSLDIEDDGPGIPESDREAVLKPFIRGSEAREKGGHGMGLAIVNRIAQWHQLSLKIDHSELLGGAKISVIYGIKTGGN